MCSQAEWDKLRRSARGSVASEDLRELMSEAAACVEALIDEIKVWTCAPEDAECVRRRQRRPRSEWVV